MKNIIPTNEEFEILKEDIASIEFIGLQGEKGENYNLTKKDKQEIAKSIKVPVVEKVIEKIIVEQPIVTNEIKEIALKDTPNEIKDKLESLKDEFRLDSSAIKGLENFAEKRAIDILDQRTQFLINKTNTGGGGGGGTWGSITGTLSNQTDLQNALNAKYDTSNPAGYITTADLSGYVPYTGATGSLNLGNFSFTTTGGYSAGTLYTLDATPNGALAASAFWHDTTKYGLFATDDDIGVFNITQTSGIKVGATGAIDITSTNSGKITLAPSSSSYTENLGQFWLTDAGQSFVLKIEGVSGNISVGSSQNFTTNAGSGNLTFGINNLQTLTSNAFNNIALGSTIMNGSSIDGGDNIGVGYNLFTALTTGAGNLAVGAYALYGVTTGNDNSAFGVQTLQNLTTGSGNLALGKSAMINATTAYSNVAIGESALAGGTGFSGDSNIGIGAGSIAAVTSGSANIGVGPAALYSLTTGGTNTAIGNSAGGVITTGSNNTIIGYNADIPTGTASNQLSICNFIYGTGMSGATSNISPAFIGIGLKAPTARLHLMAGTATANKAPLKFTAGTNLTTPELGAMEFTDNGTVSHLYITVNVAGVLTRVQII